MRNINQEMTEKGAFKLPVTSVTEILVAVITSIVSIGYGLIYWIPHFIWVATADKYLFIGDKELIRAEDSILGSKRIEEKHTGVVEVDIQEEQGILDKINGFVFIRYKTKNKQGSAANLYEESGYITCEFKDSEEIRNKLASYFENIKVSI
ncbi:MAG: hypothetical protein LBH46_04205 [Rickettsiales bacterium]|jgi:hypothetical protein|nr:hypothetical protein [Rickettsiales bacterium]